MKFVLANWGTRGEVEPFVAIGRELLRSGHYVRIAVAPEMVDFAESAGPAAVSYGPDLQSVLDAHRDFWTSFFGNPWRIQELNKSLGEVAGAFSQHRREVSATLMSLTDGADLLITGMNFEDVAANVAEYREIPLATVNHFPLRANGQLLPFLPAPLGRSAMTVFEWLSWRGKKKIEDDAERREFGLPKATGPWPRRIAERGSLEIQAYDEVCFPGLAAEWAKWDGQRPFVGALTMELPTDADEEVLSWIAAGTPPICFGFGSVSVESAADTLAMIGAACAQLGERALVCAAGTDFSHVPHFEHVKVVGAMNYAAALPGLPRGRAPRWRGHHGRGPARRSPHVDPLDVARPVALGSPGQTTESGHRPALFDHYREIAGRGPAHHPRPAIRRPGPRARRPDDQTRRKRYGRRRSCRKFRPLQACWLIGDAR